MGMLDGKVAIVTGAGNGVGRGEAIMLADHGAKVVVNDLGGGVSGGDSGDTRAADAVVDVIKSRGGEAVANYDSVADYDAAKNIIQKSCGTKCRPNTWKFRVSISRNTAGCPPIGIHGNAR